MYNSSSFDMNKNPFNSFENFSFAPGISVKNSKTKIPKYQFSAAPSKNDTTNISKNHQDLLKATKGRRRFSEKQTDVHAPSHSTDSLNAAFTKISIQGKTSPFVFGGTGNTHTIPSTPPVEQNLNSMFENVSTPFLKSQFQAKASPEFAFQAKAGPEFAFQAKASPEFVFQAAAVTGPNSAKKKTISKKKEYALCANHKLVAKLSMKEHAVASCRDCSVTFKSIFTDANLCHQCFSQSKACPIKNCQCIVSGTTVSCHCTTDKKKTVRRVVMAVKPDRSTWEIYREAGKKYYTAEKYEQAVTHYTEGIQAIPAQDAHSFAIMYTNRAAAYMMLHLVTNAIEDCLRAVEYDTQYAKAHLRLGKCYTLMGDTELALKQYNVILSHVDMDIRYHARNGFMDVETLTDSMNHAKFAKDTGDYGSVLEHTNAALQYATYCRALHEQKVQALFELKRYQAIVSYCQLLSRTTRLGLSVTYTYARALHYTGQVAEALKILHQLEQMAPQNLQVIRLVRLWNDMDRYKQSANDAFHAKRYFDAYQLYSEALELDDQDIHYCSIIFANRAATSMAIGDYDRALDDCDESLRRSPEYAKVRLHRARCNFQLNRLEQSVLDFDRYFDLDPKANRQRQVEMERQKAYNALCLQRKKEEDQRQRKKFSNKKKSQKKYNRYAWDDNDFNWDTHYSSSSKPRNYSQNTRGPRPKQVTPTKRTHYEVLGLTRQATMAEIKKNYRKLALKYHPDKSDNPKYVDLFKDMTAAYTILSDSDSKAKYDQELSYVGFGAYYEC